MKAKESTNDLKKRIYEALEKGDIPTFVVSNLLSVIYDGRTNFQLDNNKFPEVKPFTLEEFVNDIVKA